MIFVFIGVFLAGMNVGTLGCFIFGYFINKKTQARRKKESEKIKGMIDDLIDTLDEHHKHDPKGILSPLQIKRDHDK